MATPPALMTLFAVLAIACTSPESVAPVKRTDPVQPGELNEPMVPEEALADEVDQPLADEVREPTKFAVKTYDGSGEMVHPDALVFPQRWHGHRFWFAATPYPLGSAAFENPSGFAGDSAEDWHDMPGVVNPLARPVDNAYLSDPDLTYDGAHDRIRLYFRQTTLDGDQIYLRTSRSGGDWSPSSLVLDAARYSLISPAVVREPDGSWRLWAVNAAAGGCRVRASAVALTQRTSLDGRQWNPPTPVALSLPGFVPWHWDVQYIPAKHEYWALVAAFPDETNCARTSIFFARSVNGSTWSVAPDPLLAPGTIPELLDLVYRSTFRYFEGADAVRVWFSGAHVEDGKFHYALATARYPYAELLRRVNAPARAPRAVMPSRSGELRNAQVEAARESFIRAFP